MQSTTESEYKSCSSHVNIVPCEWESVYACMRIWIFMRCPCWPTVFVFAVVFRGKVCPIECATVSRVHLTEIVACASTFAIGRRTSVSTVGTAAHAWRIGTAALSTLTAGRQWRRPTKSWAGVSASIEEVSSTVDSRCCDNNIVSPVVSLFLFDLRSRLEWFFLVSVARRCQSHIGSCRVVLTRVQFVYGRFPAIDFSTTASLQVTGDWRRFVHLMMAL